MTIVHLWSHCDLSLWLMTSKSNKFIFVSNCTEPVIVVKFSQAAFNALHFIQRWIGNRKAVCPSVNRLHCDKTKAPSEKSSPWPLNFVVDRVSRGYSNWTTRGWYMDNLANFCPQLCHAVTLTFGSLTLKICARSGVMWSNYVPNFIEIDQSADELLTI